MVRRSRLQFSLAAGFTLLVTAGVALAQTRVPVRPAPKPGQVIHVTAQLEILLRSGQTADEPGPAAMQNKNVLAYTQTNGTFDAQGQLEAQVTVDHLDLDESVAGRQGPPMDTPSLKGRVLLLTLDRTGKLLTIKVPPDIKNALSLRLTQVLASAYGILNFVPAVELAVGEDTTNVSELPMRLPGNTASAPLEARTNLTLRAIERKGSDRIAHLQQRIDVATSTAQVNISGGGTIDVNLDRGFISATDTEWKFSGVMPGAAGAAQATPFYASIKINVSAN